jgi:hypothetical protein
MHYILRLTLRDRRDALDVPFIATAASRDAGLVVLRLD